MIYKYFVSYNYYKGQDLGSGNVEISCDEKINDFQQILEISNMLKEKHKFDNVIIMNYILLSKEKGSDINE